MNFVVGCPQWLTWLMVFDGGLWWIMMVFGGWLEFVKYCGVTWFMVVLSEGS